MPTTLDSATYHDEDNKVLPYPIDHDAVAAAFPEMALDTEPLGEGGMKNAYRAALGGSEVVLKVIREPLTPLDDSGLVTLPERIVREIEGMRTIEHPGIVRILKGPDAREIDGEIRGWYIEPFYAGGTLADRIGTPWSETDVLHLVRSLVEVVGVLAAHNIVHRDIKPSNVVFSADETPVLLDLGIALFSDLSPITNQFAASPRTDAYAAPEQFEVRAIVQMDFRTDLFLVGLVGFEALTGVHPFHPEADGYIGRLMTGAIDDSALLASGASLATRNFLKRLLAPKKAQRFRKMEHVAAALEGCG